MSKTKKILPELRFPEFKNDGEWEEETLGKVYDFKSTNSLSWEHLSYEKGIVKKGQLLHRRRYYFCGCFGRH